jgi:hypothetical protein
MMGLGVFPRGDAKMKPFCAARNPLQAGAEGIELIMWPNHLEDRL